MWLQLIKRPQVKILSTFINKCPTNILAVKRTDKLTGRKKKDMISVASNMGAITQGTLIGKKILKKNNP